MPADGPAEVVAPLALRIGRDPAAMETRAGGLCNGWTGALTGDVDMIVSD